MLRFPVVALLLLAAGCSAASEAIPTEAVTVRDSAGVEIVENHHPILAADAWQLTPEPVLSLPDSVATGGAPYLYDARRLKSGDLLILGADGLRWLDSAGRLVRIVATKGEGPGEFRSAGQLLVLPGDTVVVNEGAVWAMKTARWSPQGAYLGEERVDLERFGTLGRWTECQMPLLPGGSRLGCQFDPTIPTTATNRPNQVIAEGWTSPGPGLLRQFRRFYVVPPALDTAYPLGLSIGIESFGVDIGGNTEFVMHPLHARTQVTAGGRPVRIAIATNPAWEVETWSTGGQLQRLIRLDGGRHATTREEREASAHLLRQQESRGTRDPARLEQLLAAVPSPDSTPGVLKLVMSGTGELAVIRGGLWAEGFPITIDFFDPSGRWLATKEMPARWRLLDFGEDYLLGVRQDEDDLPHLELYGLKRGP